MTNSEEIPENAQDEDEDLDETLRADGGVVISNNPEIQSWLAAPDSPTIEGANIDAAVTPRKVATDRTNEITSFDSTQQLDHTVLEPFQELCGHLKGIRRTDTQLVILASSGVLKFPLNSSDARICEQELEGNIGKQISILRSMNSEQSLLICVE